MNLPSFHDKTEASAPVELRHVSLRSVVIGCVAFWAIILGICVTSLVTLTLPGLLLIGAAALVSTGGSVYFTKTKLRGLQAEFTTLEHFSRRDHTGEGVVFQYAETSRVAAALRNSKQSIRDDIEHLRRAAFRDSMTGLPNRLSLISHMESHLKSVTQAQPSVLFHLILDGFKGAGDVLGATGSQRLQTEVASRLSLYLATCSIGNESAIRDVFLAYLGTGQFALFIPDGCTRKSAGHFANELRLLFEQPFELDGRNINVSVSGGMALAPDDGDTPEILLKNASMALNEILRAGKKGFQFFSPRLERLAIGRTRFEKELRDAVDQEAFRPVFQPKVDLSTNKIIGVEALARWYRGENRIISPGTFIPLAEELGLIDEIGFQILKQSCKCAAAWRAAGMEIAVAVNVSPRQFDRPDFIDRVVEALRASRLPPHLLELEITETMAVSNPDRVIGVMGPLRAMGIKLAIDDFGTGHANLSMLAKLPFDTFKIDRQFVMHLEEDPQAPAIVEMILAMARTLGLKTVAEGIETEGQANFLRQRGCNLGQGFLYSRGVSDVELRRLLASWNFKAPAENKSA